MNCFDPYWMIGSKVAAEPLHYCPAWNEPPAMLFSEGDRVTRVNNGKVGIITGILPAPATSAMRTRPHHYYVTFDGHTERSGPFAEHELTR